MRAPVRLGLWLAVFGALPFLSVGLVMVLAPALGCDVSGAGPLPCPVLGIDIGELLYGLGMMGWLMLISWPLLLAGLALLAVAGLIVLLRWVRSGR